ARRGDMRVGAEARRTGWVDLRERGSPVVREVCGAARRPVGRDTRAAIHACGCIDRLLDPRCLGDVPARVEDGDERRLLAGAEGVQRPLIRLVGRITRNREALEPSLRHLRWFESFSIPGY